MRFACRLLLLAMVLATQARDAQAETPPPAAEFALVCSPADLVTNHLLVATDLLPALPPEATLPVLFDAGICLLQADALPSELLDALSTVQRNGVALYQVLVREDPTTRDREICHSDGTVVWRDAVPTGYDPTSPIRELWPWLNTLDSTDPTRLWCEAVYDPARIVSRVLLLPVDQLDAFLDGAADESLAYAALGGEFMQSMMLDSENLQLAGVVVSSNVVALTLSRPADFTNRVDLFGQEILATFPWSLLATAPTTTSQVETVCVSWPGEQGFFMAGDADTDSDGDGLADAREMLLHGTDPDVNDSDGDGLPDGWEITHGFDPFATDALDDPDGDRVPTIYEYHHGTNPTNADNHAITTLRVDPAAAATNGAFFATIEEAFYASAAYDVIELADGSYCGSGNAHLWFPSHPILLMSENWGTSRRAVVNYDGNLAAFYLGHRQDNRTIVRGVTLRLAGANAYQIGFWLGDGDYYAPDCGSAPQFEGVTVELGTSDANVAFFCRHSAPQPIRFQNCVIRAQRNAFAPARGIYAIDSPDLRVLNCTFMGFPFDPYAYGIQFESTSGNLGSADNPVDVDIANCVWDESFAHTNVEAFVRLQRSVSYHVSVTNCLAPRPLDWFPPDTQSNLQITNACLALGGHQRIGSPGVDGGTWPAPVLDFEGQVRDSLPDIGADEYAGFGAGDNDGDTLDDEDEVLAYGTDPYDRDSDNDGLEDQVELAMGTSPVNPFSFRVTVQGTATNQTGSTAAVRACYGWRESQWYPGTATNLPANGQFEFDVQSEHVNSGAWVNVTCDFNDNGLVDVHEAVYSQPVIVTGTLYRLSFTLRDLDGDGVSDWDEALCGTDPASDANYCVTITGSMTNRTPYSGNFRAGCSLTADASSPLAVTNVTVGGSFELPHVRVASLGTLKVHLYDDANSNAVLDAEEAFISQTVNVTNHLCAVHFDVSGTTWDKDGDGMPDFWEHRQGLSWTNAADAIENPDADALINLHESWAGTDPWTADGTNTALASAVLAIDSRIAGRNPTNALPIFVDYLANAANGVFIRNTNCWAADIDLTCCSPWNSFSGQYRAGTLISPRHVLFAAHFDQIPTNSILKFVDRQNNVIERRLIAKKQHEDYEHYYPDLTVGLLDSSVPTNVISHALVLPSGYAAHFGDGQQLPILRTDQEEKALVAEVESVASLSTDEKLASFDMPVGSARSDFGELLQDGDSGNPAFLIVGDQVILLTVATGGGSGIGTAVTVFTHDINQLMLFLGGGHTLTEANLSAYTSAGE